MQQEMLASSELYYNFPSYKSTNANIPIEPIAVRNNKYSSTETDFSSSDELDSFTEDLGRFPTTGISTSNSCVGPRRKRRQRRKRKSSSELSSSNVSLNLSLKSTKSNEERRNSIMSKTGRKRNSLLAVLHSVNDLQHAIGRHRGVSGTTTPAIDAAIFAMFYVTDVFDEMVLNALRIKTSALNISTFRSDVLALLRKEIIYSLRMSYFCPASKIVKLARLLEEHYSDAHTKDIAGFLDLLFEEVLNVPPFLRLATGSARYIQRIRVPTNFYRNYHQVLTVQHALISSGSPSWHGERIKFLTVPYPAIILEVVRSSGNNRDNLSTYYWDDSHTAEPVIPNLEIRLTELISKFNGGLYSSCDSITNSLMTSASSMRSSTTENDTESTPAKSRFMEGLKSAWKVMFQYLEDFTSSAHYTPSEPALQTGSRVETYQKRDNYPHIAYKKVHRVSYSTLANIDELASSTASTTFTKNTKESFSLSSQTDVRMELVAIVCVSAMGNKKHTHGSGFSGYSVYCKAGKDRWMENSSESLYAPWVLYQSRNGVAPQVTLIENFGKWIHSLEVNYENVTMYEIPLEIRRVLEDSKLLIYKNIE